METQKTPNSQSNLQKVKFLCMFLGSLFFFFVFLSFRKSIQSIMDLILDNIWLYLPHLIPFFAE